MKGKVNPCAYFHNRVTHKMNICVYVCTYLYTQYMCVCVHLYTHVYEKRLRSPCAFASPAQGSGKERCGRLVPGNS